MLDLDVLDGQAKFLGNDLGEGRLVALALGLDADADDRRARRMNADLGASVSSDVRNGPGAVAGDRLR